MLEILCRHLTWVGPISRQSINPVKAAGVCLLHQVLGVIESNTVVEDNMKSRMQLLFFSFKKIIFPNDLEPKSSRNAKKRFVEKKLVKM